MLTTRFVNYRSEVLFSYFASDVIFANRNFDSIANVFSRMSFSSDQVTGTVFPHLNMPFLPKSKFI